MKNIRRLTSLVLVVLLLLTGCKSHTSSETPDDEATAQTTPIPETSVESPELPPTTEEPAATVTREYFDAWVAKAAVEVPEGSEHDVTALADVDPQAWQLIMDRPEEVVPWCWEDLFWSGILGADTVYPESSVQQRIKATLLRYWIVLEEPENQMAAEKTERIFTSLWIYYLQINNRYVDSGFTTETEWFAQHPMGRFAMVACMRMPFARIIATPLDYAGQADTSGYLQATDQFLSQLMGSGYHPNVTVSGDAALPDPSLCTEHTQWRLAKLDGGVFTLTITDEAGRVVVLTYTP